jgi:hypothetical protein
MSFPRIRRRSGVEKFEIDLRTGRFRPAPEPLDIAATILLSPQRSDGPLLEPLARDDAMVRLAADQPYAARQPGWRRFVDTALMRGAWVLRRGPTPRATLDALAPWLTVQEAVG